MAKPLRQSLADEARYALSDIRAAWERAWFGQPVTPTQWQSDLTEALTPQDLAEERHLAEGPPRQDADWQARCRAFFEGPAADTPVTDSPEPTRMQDSPER